MTRIMTFRADAALIDATSAAASAQGLSQSDYLREAIAAMNERVMSERIANLSKQFSAQSLAAAESMEGTLMDGLDA